MSSMIISVTDVQHGSSMERTLQAYPTKRPKLTLSLTVLVGLRQDAGRTGYLWGCC